MLQHASGYLGSTNDQAESANSRSGAGGGAGSEPDPALEPELRPVNVGVVVRPAPEKPGPQTQV